VTDRNMTAGMIDEVAKDLVRPVYLVELEFDSGTVRYTDAAFDISYGGHTYDRTAGLLSFSGISETGDLLVNQIEIQLAGADTSLAMTKVLTDDFLDRPCRIYLAMLDTAMAVISDPVKIFEGRMDAPSIVEDPESGTSTVSVRGTPVWVDFGRRPGRHTNDEEQQFYFAGDKFFEFVSSLPKSIKWGRV
jgi:hypothetical protein